MATFQNFLRRNATRSSPFKPPLSSFTRFSVRMVSSAALQKLKDPSLFKEEAFINGKWLKANSGKTFDIEDPATGDKIGTCPDMGPAELNDAVAAANAAFKTFRHTSPKERHDLLLKFFRLVQENADDLAAIITLENGKSQTDAKGEVAYSASFLEWFAEEAVRGYGDVIPSSVPGLRNVVIKQPIGVCGIICPWNFPAAMGARKFGAAFAVGCTVVMKAPAETPYTALALAELAHRAGFPPGVFNVITTDNGTKEIGKALCEHPDVRKVSFTGSTAVGKLLMSQASSTMKKLSFELGGNAPFIVFEDADLDAAVAGAVACKFRSTAQTCVCANRIFVQSSIYDKFATAFVEAVKKFKTGNGFHEGVTHGPLIHQRSLDKVQSHVDDAVFHGAKCILGGNRVPGNGYFYEPTVLTEVSRKAMLHKEETFGPVAGLFRFETEEEVIEMANDTEVGLAGYFYSKDIGRVWRVAEALEVGMVGANTGMLSSAVIPFGGVKESGYGREGSKYGTEDYTITKYIAMGF